jgi:hypothetical protein
MKLEVNEREALLIVSALGKYQNRVGQKARWFQRKRLTTLRSQLADNIVIGEGDEVKALHRAIHKTNRRAERLISLGLEVSNLRERIKADTGITDERVITDDDIEQIE